MNATGKQLIAFWLHKKGEKWMVKSLDRSDSEESFNQHKCGLYHYITPENVFKSIIIIRLKNVGQEITKVLHLLQIRNKKVVHMETRVVDNAFQFYVEIESPSSKDWSEIRNILETLNGIEIEPVEEKYEDPEVPQEINIDLEEATWFPRTINDIDHFQKVYMAGTDLDADHPGFKDSVYRKRRRMFSEVAIFHRHGMRIPYIKYTEEEKRTWKTIFNELRKLHQEYASDEYNENWKDLVKYCGYREDNIPQLEDINSYLKKKTGFQIRPVAGYLSPRDFLAALAFRVFHCTQYIRHGSDPFYTPEPDCCHEILGHMPLLADTSFAQFSQEIGLASLGASETDLQKLVSCYFFTVEFGLCKENGRMKIYGAGLLSSVAEIKYVMEGIEDGAIDISKFSVEKASETECMVTTYQKRYFYTETLEDAKRELRELVCNIKRPFEVRYNPYTQSIETLNTSGEIMDAAQELQGDVCLIANAVKKMKEKGHDISITGITDILGVKNNISKEDH